MLGGIRWMEMINKLLTILVCFSMVAIANIMLRDIMAWQSLIVINVIIGLSFSIPYCIDMYYEVKKSSKK